MRINAPWRFLPLFACILAVAFFACSKEDKQLASGYTEEGNAWNGLDSTVAEILRTWDPEIPVDSVERRGTGANEGKSWYQVDFATDGQEFYSYDAAADSMTCAVKIFGEENGVRLDLQASDVQMSISQVLTRDSLEAVVTDRMDVTYSGDGVVESCRADSTKFASACAEESGEMVDRFALEACTELHLVCVRRLQTPPLKANDYLVATAQAWIELYGDQSVMVDSRDGQVYRIVDVGGVTWMAQNLNYAYRAPTSLWDSTSFCYDDDPAMCEKHGRLYTFAAVIDSAGLLSDEGKGCGFQVMCNLGRDVQGICPDGWRVPNYDEYTALIEAAGGPGSDGEGVAGRNLKAVEYGGTDVFGFSMLVSGRHIEFVRMSDPESESLYDYMDNDANYWTITESTSEALLAYRFFADYDYVGHDQVTKYIAHPLRCVKGEAPKFAPGQIDPAEVVKSTFTDSRDGTVYNTVKVADQVWMAEYLRYAVEGVAVCYDYLEENCEKYGMLYPSANPEDSTETGLIQSYCPDGWHLPSLDEYLVLAQHAGPSFVGLKSTEGWTVRAGNGTNEYGFNALPGGRGVMKNDTLSFNSMGEEALFWLSTYDDFMDSLYVVIPPLSGPTTLSNYSLVSARSYAYIRCLQD